MVHLSLRFLMTLAIAFAGGWLFNIWNMPLPWMLGALCAVTLATLLRVPVYGLPQARPPMAAVIGVMLGAGFHPGLWEHLVGWLPSFLGLVLLTATAGLACAAYLHWVARLDRATAYFAGMPGGLIEMVEVGRERGGDEMTIALMHSARIFLIVMTVPFLVQALEGTTIASASPMGETLRQAHWSSFALLVSCAGVGIVVGGWLRLPAHTLVGPMLVSAALHLAGLTTFEPPTEIVQAAQLVLGALIGSRFRQATPRVILRTLLTACGLTVVLVTVVAVFAGLMSILTSQTMSTLILAYSPGGLNEMGLIALAVQADIAFVAAHHLVRILLVNLGAAPVFALFGYLSHGPQPQSRDIGPT